MYLCYEFLEEYKRLDALCKDCLRSSEGVSEYIRQMEDTYNTGARYVYTWESDYKQLKHVRWVRNQLAHTVGAFDSGICTREDLDWVICFHNRIIQQKDPFSVLRAAKEEQRLRAIQAKQARKAASAMQQAQTNHQPPEKAPRRSEKKPSLRSRLSSIIKNFFFE